MRLLTTTVLMLALLVSVSLANENEVPLTFQQSGDRDTFRIVPDGPQGQPMVEIVGSDQPSTTTIVVVEKPQVTTDYYLVTCQIKCENVAGDGYLETWNDFELATGPESHGQSSYFSRTLADYGTNRKVTGTKDWRDLQIPFQARVGQRPSRITLNVVLPAGGKVWITSPKLRSILVVRAWWDERMSGILGGIFGTLGGTYGALIGFLGWRGASRKVMFGMLYSLMGLGVLSTLVGLIALALSQPWHVYYMFLLMGGILIPVAMFNIALYDRRFQQDELRRMTAIDV